MSNINVCFAAFRCWQLLERKSSGRKSKVKKERKIRHKWHASEVLPWSQSISGNTHRIRRPVYISLRKLLSVIVSYAPPLLLTAITWQYYTCMYKWGYGTGVIYIYITVCIIFFLYISYGRERGLVVFSSFRINIFCDVFPGEICFVSVHHHYGQINSG